jgi:PAS domain S-box-containing protein
MTITSGSMIPSGVEGTHPVDPLNRLEELERALAESTIVAATDQRGVIQYVNEKFCEISGYTRDELVGKDHRILNSGYHPKSFFRELWRTIGSGGIWRGELRNRAKDGHIYWVATTIVPFLDERGKPYRYLAIRHDITDQKRAEEALKEANARLLEEQSNLVRAEKLSSIGVLAAGVAHEINNPLAGAMACVKALQTGNLEAEREQAYLQAVADGLDRIRSTVGNLLDYARQRPPAARCVDASEVVSSALRLLEVVFRKSHLAVEDLLEPGALQIHGDPSQLMQAMVNVLLNAAHASHAGGRITVSGRRDERGWVDLQVRDHGVGIPEEIANRICDPFFTTKAEGEGTGLGLAVTASIIDAHGGQLRFDSRAGEGTTVHLILPPEQRAPGDRSAPC